MSQYRTGTVGIITGTNLVYGDIATNWTAIVAGNWLAIKGSNVTYNVGSVAQTFIGSYSAWASMTSYALGATVSRNGGMYVSLGAANAGHDPATSPAYWFQTSGWTLTLTTDWPDDTIATALYGIVTDFTETFALPLPQPGDVEVPAIVSRAFQIFETIVLSANGLLPNTRQGLSVVNDESSGDMFGMEQVSAAQTGDNNALRLFTSAVSGAYIAFGEYTNATVFNEFGRFTAGGILQLNALSFTLGTTYKITFSESITTNRAVAFPDAAGTVVLDAATQTLTNKSIAATQLTGALQAAQFPALSGAVTTTAGSLVTTLNIGAIVNSNLATMAAYTLKGNNTSGSAAPADLTATQAKSLLAIAQADVSGLTAASTPTFAALNLNGLIAATLSGSGNTWSTFLQAGLGISNTANLAIGQSLVTYDSAVFGFSYAGASSTANFAYLGTFGSGVYLAVLPSVIALRGYGAGILSTDSSGTISSGALSFTGLSGVLQASQFPALTGDVTTAGGSLATTIAAGAVTLAKHANLAANSFVGNNTGSAATPLALSISQAKALLAIANTDVSGLGTYSVLNYPLTTLGDVPYGGASGAGTRLAGNTSTTRQFLRQTGTGTVSAAPVWDSITAADLPLPSTSSLGGIEAINAVSHQWISYIDTSGVPHLAQPAFADVSGSVAASQMPALTGDATTSAGAVAVTVSKVNGVSYGASPATNTVPVVTSANTITYEAVPNAALAYSSILIAGTSTSLGGSITLDTLLGVSTVGLLKRSAGNTVVIAVGGTDYVASLTGTSGQVAITGSLGALTLSLPTNLTGISSLAATGSNDLDLEAPTGQSVCLQINAITKLQVNPSGNILGSSTTDQSGVATGAFQLAGGAAIAKSLLVGTTLTTAAPTGGTAAPTTFGAYGNGTIQQGVSGTLYYSVAFPAFAAGDMVYASGSNQLSRLTAIANSALVTNSSGIPIWSQAMPAAVQLGAANFASGAGASTSSWLRGDGTWQTLTTTSLSQGVGVTFSGGNINIGQPVAANSYVQFAGVGAGTAGNSTDAFVASLVSGQRGLHIVQATGETSAVNLLDIATTWNNAANSPVAFNLSITNTTVGAGALLANWLVNSTSVFEVDLSGNIKNATWEGVVVSATYGGTGATSIGGSLTVASSTLKLSGDISTPGNLCYYGTNGSGTKGWYTLASGDVASVAGTANQVLVNGVTTAQTGAVTLTLPQSIGTGSTVTFGGIQNTPIGSTTASTGAFTTLTATVSGSVSITRNTTTSTGTYDLWKVNGTSVGAIGTADQLLGGGSVNDFVIDQVSASHNVVIGISTSPVATFTSTGLNSTAIGATTPAAGTFTTLAATGNVSAANISHGTWTPTLNGFTIVNGTGAVTVTGNYTVDASRHVHLDILVTGTGTATIANSGYGTGYIGESGGMLSRAPAYDAVGGFFCGPIGGGALLASGFSRTFNSYIFPNAFTTPITLSNTTGLIFSIDYQM